MTTDVYEQAFVLDEMGGASLTMSVKAGLFMALTGAYIFLLNFHFFMLCASWLPIALTKTSIWFIFAQTDASVHGFLALSLWA